MNITVSTSTNPIEAHIICGRLKAEGIPAFVIFQHHIWAEWWISNAIGGVRVQVPPNFYQQAQTVIQNINLGVYELTPDNTTWSPSTRCPKCNSLSISHINWRRKVALVLAITLHLPLHHTQHLMRCDMCSNKWIAREQRGYPIYFPLIATIILFAIFFSLYSIFEHWCTLHCD
tara:strand:- start:339 stop:860 length:522 start_codon:yes stop_codon:yes gene_type:complete